MTNVNLDSEPEPNDHIKEQASIVRVLRRSGEAISLGGAVLFVVAILFNTWVFSKWGANFIEIATPADVISAGVSAAIASLPVLVAIALGVAVELKTLLQLFGRLPLKTAPAEAAIYFALTLTIILASIKAVVELLGYEFIPIVDRNYIYMEALLAFPFFVVSVRIIMDGIKLESAPRSLIISVVCIFITGSVMLLDIPALAIAGNGFIDTNNIVQFKSVKVSCKQTRVLWVGERSIVVSCINSSGLSRQHYDEILPENTLVIRDPGTFVISGASSAAAVRFSSSEPHDSH